jgi:GNAT superfamily N-acetyltransferase
MRGLHIREAVTGEGSELTELAVRSKAHWGYSPEFLARARPELAVSEHDIAAADVYVALLRGRTVGFVAVELGERPELTALFVEPELIGSGVGGALLEHALERARAAGVDCLVIESDPNAEPFYRSRGAVPAGYRRSPSTGRRLPLLRLHV